MIVVQALVQRTDSMRAALDSVFAGSAYRWVEVARPEGILSRVWRQLTAWVYQLQRAHPSAFAALFWVLVAGLAMVLLHAGWVAWVTVRGASAASERSAMTGPPIRDATWYGQEAHRLAQAGRFAEAMQTDFVRLMLELDARNVVRFHPSKTPSEFANEVPPGGLRESLGDLARTLYRYAFARESCGPAEYDAWRSRTVADRYAPAN